MPLSSTLLKSRSYQKYKIHLLTLFGCGVTILLIPLLLIGASDINPQAASQYSLTVISIIPDYTPIYIVNEFVNNVASFFCPHRLAKEIILLGNNVSLKYDHIHIPVKTITVQTGLPYAERCVDQEHKTNGVLLTSFVKKDWQS